MGLANAVWAAVVQKYFVCLLQEEASFILDCESTRLETDVVDLSWLLLVLGKKKNGII